MGQNAQILQSYIGTTETSGNVRSTEKFGAGISELGDGIHNA
jgi:hypothetical protein